MENFSENFDREREEIARRPLASAALFFVVGFALGSGRLKEIREVGLSIAESLGDFAYGRLSEHLEQAFKESNKEAA